MNKKILFELQERLKRIPIDHYLVILEDSSSDVKIRETIVTDFNQQGKELEGQLYLLYLAYAKYCALKGIRITDALRKAVKLTTYSSKKLSIDQPIHQTLDGYRLVNIEKLNKYNKPPRLISSQISEMEYLYMNDLVEWLKVNRDNLCFTNFLVIGSINGQFAFVDSPTGIDSLNTILPNALTYVSKKVHTPLLWSIDAIKHLIDKNNGGRQLPYLKNLEDYSYNKFLYTDEADQLKIASKGIAEVLSPDWHERMNDIKMIKILHHLKNANVQQYILFAESKSTYYLGISKFINYKEFENNLKQITESLTSDPTYNITLRDLQHAAISNKNNKRYLDKFNFDCSNAKFYGVSTLGSPKQRNFQKCWSWSINTLGNTVRSCVLNFIIFADGKLSIGNSFNTIDGLARQLKKKRIIKLYNDLLGNIATMFDNRSPEFFLNYPNKMQ